LPNEAVIDFSDTYALYNRSLVDIGQEIKQRFKKEIGEWMVCSIGISTNRFLAKLAASLKKPDGLETIDHTNVLSVYAQVSLLDLNGINTRNEARLNASGIFTPMEFLQAPLETLKRQVFQSILGYYWYLRLRGYEIDQVDFGRKSFGNTYALGKQTNDPKELSKHLKHNWQLARNIQNIRKAKQITQEELAERLNVSQSWLARIETGREVPNLRRLQQIARVLGVKAKDLIPY
jgi:DNA polymerase IV